MVDIPTVPIHAEEDCDIFSVLRLNSLTLHHKLLCDKLQALAERKIPNLMLLFPPGSAKSTYTDVVFVPWFMWKFPREPVILGSYASDIARKQGRRARQLINSPSYRNLTGLTLKTDQKAAHEWALSNESEFMAGGLTSGLTGNRAGLGIIDDPIKGRKEAESEVTPQSTWDAYIDDFCSRLKPGAPQVMILTRWVQDDPAGRILPEGWNGESGLIAGRDGRTWDVVCVPAICDRGDDPLARKIGEGLWPEWFPLSHWEPFKRNRRTWVSLYQQKPTDEEGTFFQKVWFRRYVPEQLPKNLHKYLTSDHAPQGNGPDSDFNCFRIWGIDEISDVWLVDGFRIQETLDKSMERVVGKKAEKKIGLIQRHNPFAWFPEDDNNWKAVEGFVKTNMQQEQVYCAIHPISPHGDDKLIKAQGFQSIVSMGRVHVPFGPEGDEIIAQYTGFPMLKHDDEVDNGSILGRAINSAHPAIMPRGPAPAPKFPAQMSVSELIAQRSRARRAEE